MSINENLLGSLSEETSQEIEDSGAERLARQPKTDSLRRDLLAENFRSKIDNIYETVIVLSQRARQIGQQQASVIEQFLAAKIKPDSDETEEEAPAKKPPEDDEDAPKLPKFEKPTVLAMNELLKGNIAYKYKE